MVRIFDFKVFRPATVTAMLLLVSTLLSACIPLAVDCSWNGSAIAWLDENQNGNIEEDENPLEGILLKIDDVENDYSRVGERAVSDSNGIADLSVWLPGCPSTDFIVYAEAPVEYQHTTPARLRARDQSEDQPFQFGFSYTLSATPTPRPKPTPLACKQFSIPYIGSSYPQPITFLTDGSGWTASELHEPRLIRMEPGTRKVIEYSREEDFLGSTTVNQMVTGPDDSIWLTTPSGITQFQPEPSNWTSHIEDNGLHSGQAWNIAVLPSNDVLVETEAGIELLNARTVSWSLFIERAALGDISFSKFLQVNGDVFFITNDKIFRFWRDEESQDLGQELIWSREVPPDMPIESITGGAIESNEQFWLSGYSPELGYVVTHLDLRDDLVTTFSYRTTGGAIGTSVISDMDIANDGSIWLNEGMGLIQGNIQDNDLSRVNWISYEPTDLGLAREAYGPQVTRMIVAPDGSLWLGTRYNWYRCPLTP